MNRLRMLLITTALITGSSALASAQEPYKAGFAVQVRLNGHDHDGDDRRVTYRRGDGDHDRDDRFNRRFRDDDDHYRRVVYSDHRWLDAQGRMCYDPAYWRFDVRFGWMRR